MFNSGRVVTTAAFQVWATADEAVQRRNGVLAALPPYALSYDPTVIPQLGKVYVKLGESPAPAGFYYPAERPGDSRDRRAGGRQRRAGTRRAGNPSPGRHCDEEVTGCPSR